MSRLVTVYTVRRTSRTAQARNTVGDAVVDVEYVATGEAEAIKGVRDGSVWASESSHFNWRVTGARVLVVPESSRDEVESLQEKLNLIHEYLDRTSPMGEYVDPAPIHVILKEAV